jgi:WD40 repeat protein
MLIVAALVALAPAQRPPLAPPPRDARGWVPRHTLTHKAPVTAVAATADGYVTGDKTGVLLLWDAKTGKLRETLLDGKNENLNTIDAVRPTPDGKRLNVIINRMFGQIEMTGKERTLHGPDVTWPVFAIAHDGEGFARSNTEFFGDSGTLCVLRYRFMDDGGRYIGLAYRMRHPADARLAASAPAFVASADVNHTVRGWALKKDGDTLEKPAWSVDCKELDPQALAVSPDGALVAVAGAVGTVEVFKAKRGESVATLKGHAGAARCLAFAPDSGLLATGGADGTVRLWNPWTGEQEQVLKGHSEPVAAVSFASDEVLMTASEDKTARVWVYKP